MLLQGLPLTSLKAIVKTVTPSAPSPTSKLIALNSLKLAFWFARGGMVQDGGVQDGGMQNGGMQDGGTQNGGAHERGGLRPQTEHVVVWHRRR